MSISRGSVFVLLIFQAALAQAAAQRTFVASGGSDSNPCSVAQPCRSFGQAITQTNAGGEVIVLDSAGYGAVTITQAVSIIAPPGIYAGLSVFSGDGVTINAPGSPVVLRGLTINGQGGNNGVTITAASEVHVENVVVANMGNLGIFMNAAATLVVKDSIFRGNTSRGLGLYAGNTTMHNVRSDRNFADGLYMQAGVASATGGSFSENVANGIRVEGGTLTVNGAVISGNQNDGVFDNNAHLTLEACSIDSNASWGVDTIGGVRAYISGTQVNLNAAGGVRVGSGGVNVSITGLTALHSLGFDVEANNCCLYTYQNNSIESFAGTLNTTYFQVPQL